MNNLTTVLQQLATRNIEDLEADMMKEEQADCPVVHHFGPGICIRELSMTAGTLAIGHRQKYDHVNIVLKGKVAILTDQGDVQIITAPLIFNGKPGRKIGIVLEDVVWQNVYATELTDVASVEEHFLDKSPVFQDVNLARFNQLSSKTIEDRVDFELMLQEHGLSADEVRRQSEDISDLIYMPSGSWRFKIDVSPIQGTGIFATMPIAVAEVIGPGRINGKRTPIGRYTNHSKNPNAKFVVYPDGNIELVAIKNISGCRGGYNGEEITVDYRQVLNLKEQS